MLKNFLFFSIFALSLQFSLEALTVTNVEIDGKDLTKKTNKQNPVVNFEVIDSINGIATKPHALTVNADVLALWHFDEKSNLILTNEFFEDAKNSAQLVLKNGGISVVANSNPNFSKALEIISNENYYLTNPNILRAELQTGAIEFWFKPLANINQTLSAPQYFVYKGLDIGKHILSLRLGTDGSLEWINYDGNSEKVLKSTKRTWLSNEWYYVSCNFDGNSKKIFINGKLDNSVASDGKVIANSNDFNVCGTGLSSNDSFLGNFDELRISSTKYSDEQILANYFSAAYKISRDQGVSWDNWERLDFGAQTQDGSKSANALILSTNTLNFVSSFEANKIVILLKDTLNNFATSQYTVKIDTIPPPNVQNFNVSSPDPSNMKILLNWNAVEDEPGQEKIASYEIFISTQNPANYPDTKTWSLVALISNSITPGIKGLAENFEFLVTEVETDYFVNFRTYDGFQNSDFLTTTSVKSNGLKNITNFRSSEKTRSSIVWTWQNNTSRATKINFYDENMNFISQLPANTTFYLETNLEVGKSYTRYIQAQNSTFGWSTSISQAVEMTVSDYQKDIDSDGYAEFFTNGSLIDNFAPISRLIKAKNNLVFFSLNQTQQQIFPTHVWILDEDFVSEVWLFDVDGDGIQDYVYKSKNSSQFDRFFNVASEVISGFGTLRCSVKDQTGNIVDGANLKIFSSTQVVTGITNSVGVFEMNLAAATGQKIKITVEKNGFQSQEISYILENGKDNSVDIKLVNYNLNVSKDDIHNYPNPFKKGGTSKIVFNVKTDGDLKIFISGGDGKILKKLVDGYKTRGSYELDWNGKNDQNKTLEKGLYYLIFKMGSSKIVKKIVIN